MSLRKPGLWLGAVTLLLVLALVAMDLERSSPGPLSAAHAQQAELAASRGCDLCHGGFLQSMGGSCAECHRDIEQQLAAGTGLHGAIAAVDASRCERCHSEHRGPGFQLVSRSSFALAGLGDRERFDHGHVRFGLKGRHASLACADCHEHADDEVLAAGDSRFLGLVQACASCHADPHDGRFARSCAACHGQEHPFAELANFTHVDTFPLAGGHAGSTCADCHVEGSAHAIEALAGFEPAPPPRSCADCHDDSPHRYAFLDGVAALASAPGRTGCELCHDAAHGSFSGELELTAELHVASGFDLLAPHADVACSACHPRDAGSFLDRHPGRTRDDCGACHADPHGTDFETGPFAGAGCLECHRESTFSTPSFGLAAHARTDFPLEGGHAAVGCAACHSHGHSDGPRAFSGAPTECAACHADAHADFFAEFEGCDACHTTTTFDDEAVAAAFDHAASASFTLDGAHAGLACEACHARSAHPDATGRTFGRVSAVFREPTKNCSACHASVHDPFFAATTCAACHSTAAFAPVTGTFDHGAKTHFPLDGRHAGVGCAECHGTYPDAASAGRSLGRVHEVFSGPLDQCATCHSDVHRGAFARAGLPASIEGREGCARCHDTSGFAGARAHFDHGRWTGYPLEGAHATASCTACHSTSAGAPLGPAAGSTCASCHVDPHAGQFARGGPADCARCHQETSPFDTVAFDHQRDSRFALDEAHARLDCAACHVPWPLADGTEVVRYRPLGTRCIDCHDHGGRGKR